MATITLDVGKKFVGLELTFKGTTQKVSDLATALSKLKSKVNTVKTVTDVGSSSNAVSNANNREEHKKSALSVAYQKIDELLSNVGSIDNRVAGKITKRKDNFYKKYSWLKPECEKGLFEKAKDYLWNKVCIIANKIKNIVIDVAKWCKKHWKAIVTALILIVAVAVLILVPVGGGILATILIGAAKGAILGAIIGGLAGGIESVNNGGSFWEGVENGAFGGAISGALTGALFAGIGVGGEAFGKLLGTSCKWFKVFHITTKISSVISVGMGGFDLLALGISVFDYDNPIVQLNRSLHSNKAYNYFQIGVSALSVFSSSVEKGMLSNGTPTCFVAGTLVMTIAGFKAIENIRIGDQVIATNANNMQTSARTVMDTFVRATNRLVYITVQDEKIVTTENHPFYVNHKGFIEAEKLNIGDELIDKDGNVLLIKDCMIETLSEAVTVYNLKVEDFHTYHVSELCILVHNADYANRQPKKGVIKEVRHDDGSVTYTKKIGRKMVDVTYGPDGYPDFSNYTHPEYSQPVEINMTGNNNIDFRQANSKIGLSGSKPPKGYTWHHMEDGKSMILVRREIHSGFPHTGGASIARKGGV